jgi:tRNA modification GTPase
MGRLTDRLSVLINEKLSDLTAGHVVTSARHQKALSTAARQLRRAAGKVRRGESPELTAFDLRQAVNALDEITGRIYTEDILEDIFSRFCIGK